MMDRLSRVITAFVFSVLSVHATELPNAALTVQVIDEANVPVAGASVRIGFEAALAEWGHDHPAPVQGLSDAEGKFSGSGHSGGHLGAEVRKDGYYPSYSDSIDFKDLVNKQWQPWNPTIQVLLKKIVNPVPMYARRARLEVPVLDRPIGFDLVDCDWVAPYGDGKVADLVFRIEKRFQNRRDFDASLTLTFSNLGDGIEPVPFNPQYGSFLRLPRTAPETGYEQTWVSRMGHNAKNLYDDQKKDRGYLLKVRTVKENGRIKSALYGKIPGEIQFDVVNSKTATILFTYYLNPDGTRNLEFDPQRNLLTDLKPTERVTDP